LAINFTLVEVRVEVARIRPVAHVHDKSAEIHSMAYFCTARGEKSDDYDVGEKAKSHPFIYQERFGESTEN
jgi:hypothetical protein